MAKLTTAQRATLQRIAWGGDRDRNGLCSRYDARHPRIRMEVALLDAGLIEIVDNSGFPWPIHHAAGYRITDAGRLALSPTPQEAER